MKNNIFTYAYRGIVATVLFLVGKKKKIPEVYNLDNEIEAVNLNNTTENSSYTQRESGKPKIQLEVDKLHFRYKAKNSKGKIISSTFDANTIEAAKKFLEGEGLEVIEIKPRDKYDFDIVIGSQFTISELSFALTQISTYIKAGISLIDGVRVLAKQTENPQKRKIYEQIIYELLSGTSFSEALEKQPKCFPKLLINMVKTAELTGDLANVLDDMAEYYTAMDKTKKEIKSALAYPIAVMIFAVVVVAFVLVYVVPQYKSMFEGFGQELPKITVVTVAISEFLQTKLLYILAVIAVIVVLYIYLFKKSRLFRLTMQTFFLHVPGFKNIIMYSEVSMFTKTFASLLNHGVYITDSMDVLLKVSENEVYRNIISDTVKNLNAGGKISDSFKDNWAIPMVAYEMIVTGESTGKLGTMMDKVYHYYDDMYHNAINAIKSMMEPIIIVFLAGTVGLIILAVIVPMFTMYESLS